MFQKCEFPEALKFQIQLPPLFVTWFWYCVQLTRSSCASNFINSSRWIIKRLCLCAVINKPCNWMDKAERRNTEKLSSLKKTCPIWWSRSEKGLHFLGCSILKSKHFSILFRILLQEKLKTSNPNAFCIYILNNLIL